MGVPQGSVLAPILYNIYASDIEENLPRDVKSISYADDVVIYSSNMDIQYLIDTIETSGNMLCQWCTNNCLELSPEKSELVLFSKKYKLPNISIQLESTTLHTVKSVKYLGVIFDTKLLWRKHIETISVKVKKRLNFMRAISGKNWGAHPDTQLALFKAVVRPQLDYGSFLFMGAAKTYLLRLQRLQWAALRIVIGSFPSSPNSAVEVITGIQPLQVRYDYLADKFLISCIISTTHPVDSILRSLWDTNNKGFILRHSSISQYDLGGLSEPLHSQISYEDSLIVPITDTNLYQLTKDISEISLHSVAAIFKDYTQKKYPNYEIVYTDGSKIDKLAGASFYHNDCQEAYRLVPDTSSYIAEVTALYKAVEHLKKHNGGKYLLATDSLSCVQRLSSATVSDRDPEIFLMLRKTARKFHTIGFDLVFLWCPAHRGIPGNDKADELAKWGTQNGLGLSFSVERDTVLSIVRAGSMLEWQNQWDICETGRYTYSLFPCVSSKPWFKKIKLPKNVIRTISRIILNHYALKSHLARFDIVDSPICDCNENYETVDHILWECNIRNGGRESFIQHVKALGLPTGDVRLLVCHNFLVSEAAVRIHTFIRRHKLSI